MFQDSIAGLSRTQDTFNEQVRDAFGRSIDAAVFQPAIEALRQMELAHEEAELKKGEIQALTLELRMIL